MSVESVDDTPLTFDDPSLDWGKSEPDASSVSEPSADASAPASSPEAATVPPVDTPPADAKPRDNAGPIPFDRHQQILASERQKREEMEGKLGWASDLLQQGHTREQVQEALAIASGLRGDSLGFIRQLLTEAVADQRLAGDVRSLAAQILGTGRQAEPAAVAEVEPKPDLYYEHPDGRREWVRSAENQQAWLDWKLARSFDERLKPYEEVRQDLETRRAHEKAEADFRAEKTRLEDGGAVVLDQLKKQPYFNEKFMDDIREYYRENPNTGQNPDMFLLNAWIHILNSKTVPMLTEKGRSDAIADLRTKAAASSVSPRPAASGVSEGPKTFFDPSLQWK